MTEPCEICHGTGKTTLCSSCGGQGIIGVMDCYERRCDDCDAKGFVPEHACLACQPAAAGPAHR